jgi:ElaB/YqjD/DUF883 family membrane-anchored ribosome-binding protein
MNDKAFEDKVKEDLDSVKQDGSTGLNRLEDKIIQSAGKVKEYLTTWSEDGAAQVTRKLEHLKGDVLDKVIVTAKTVEQDVDQGMNQYNVKVQELADQVPGGFSKKAARYPWVTISISLAVGMLLGMLLKPARQPLGLL